LWQTGRSSASKQEILLQSLPDESLQNQEEETDASRKQVREKLSGDPESSFIGGSKPK